MKLSLLIDKVREIIRYGKSIISRDEVLALLADCLGEEGDLDLDEDDEDDEDDEV